MDSETQKIIDEQLKIIPPEVKAAIISVDYKTKLQEITRRQRLLIDQAGKLEMETTLVMIGLEPLADFTENIRRELMVNCIRASEIALDVSEHIFKPIRDALQKMNEVTEAEEEETNLNRDQILNEIENPVLNHQPTPDQINFPPPEPVKRELETRPTQEISVPPQNILEAKMTSATVSRPQVVEVKTRPTGGTDPYREPLS